MRSRGEREGGTPSLVPVSTKSRTFGNGKVQCSK
jgi:hypothetical protein